MTGYLVFNENDEYGTPVTIFSSEELAQKFIEQHPDGEWMFVLPYAIHESEYEVRPTDKESEEYKSQWNEYVENEDNLLLRAEGFLKFARPDQTTGEIMRDFVIYELRRVLKNVNSENLEERNSDKSSSS